MPETITIRGEGITLDLLLWRRYGVRGQALVEAALRLNPGLAALGPVLPLGIAVKIPELPPATQSTRRYVSMFGVT